MKHKSRQQNKVANALIRRATSLVILVNEVVDFECLKDLYVKDEDFVQIWDHCFDHQNAKDFLI